MLLVSNVFDDCIFQLESYTFLQVQNVELSSAMSHMSHIKQ